MVNLTPLSEDHPYLTSVSEYNRLKNLKHKEDWTVCQSEVEWLVKLHFVRKCFKEKRIDGAKFLVTERSLVQSWLSKP